MLSLSFLGSWTKPTQLWRSVLKRLLMASMSRTYEKGRERDIEEDESSWNMIWNNCGIVFYLLQDIDLKSFPSIYADWVNGG